jgi:hypothetical protein
MASALDDFLITYGFPAQAGTLQIFTELLDVLTQRARTRSQRV